MVSASALACKSTGLEHPIVFSPGEPTLPTAEILKLAEWNTQLKEDFSNGGKYRVLLQEEPEAAFEPELAILRLRSIQAALDAVGIEGEKVESSEADAHLRAVQHEGAAPRMATAAYVVFQPDCPQPCCTDPAPGTPPPLNDARQPSRPNQVIATRPCVRSRSVSPAAQRHSSLRKAQPCFDSRPPTRPL